MPSLPDMTGPQAIRALENLGFHEDRRKGSHVVMKKDGHPKVVTVPDWGKKSLKKGTLRSIIRDAEVTIEEFIEASR